MNNRVSSLSFHRVLNIVPKRIKQIWFYILGLISISFKSDSDFYFNKDLPKFVSCPNSWMLWNSWEDESPNWEISICSFPLFLSNISIFSTLSNVSVLGLSCACNLMGDKIPSKILPKINVESPRKIYNLFEMQKSMFSHKNHFLLGIFVVSQGLICTFVPSNDINFLALRIAP